MADKQKCTGTLPDNVRVSLDPNSTIDLTGAWHGLEMPDLASFAGAGYPFTTSTSTCPETIVMMDDRLTEAAIEAFLDVMGRLGDLTGVATTGVTVTLGGNADQLSDHDILVIGSANLAGSSLFANAPLRNEGGTLKVIERSALQYVESLLGGWGKNSKEDVENTVYASKGFNGITAFESP
jgi:cellulose synthase (UDP-forming)